MGRRMSLLSCWTQDECLCAKAICRLLSAPLHSLLAAGVYPLTQGVSISLSRRFCLKEGLRRICTGKSLLLMLLAVKTSACQLHGYTWFVQ